MLQSVQNCIKSIQTVNNILKSCSDVANLSILLFNHLENICDKTYFSLAMIEIKFITIRCCPDLGQSSSILLGLKLSEICRYQFLNNSNLILAIGANDCNVPISSYF